MGSLADGWRSAGTDGDGGGEQRGGSPEALHEGKGKVVDGVVVVVVAVVVVMVVVVGDSGSERGASEWW